MLCILYWLCYIKKILIVCFISSINPFLPLATQPRPRIFQDYKNIFGLFMVNCSDGFSVRVAHWPNQAKCTKQFWQFGKIDSDENKCLLKMKRAIKLQSMRTILLFRRATLKWEPFCEETLSLCCCRQAVILVYLLNHLKQSYLQPKCSCSSEWCPQNPDLYREAAKKFLF